MAETKGYSTSELLKFLDYASEKGLMKPATANSQRAACSQVFAVLEETERQDVRSLSLEAAFERFTNLKGSNLKPDSMRTYKHRLEKAIEGFLNYKKDPANWRPSVQARMRAGKKNGSEKRPIREGEHDMEPVRQGEGGGAAPLVIPFPLREGVVIRIAGVPTDLKTSEAKRMAAFIATLATDFEPSGK